MNDSGHAVSAYRFLDAIGIGDIGDNECRATSHGPAEAGRQVVDYDDLFACVQKLQDHVAADIAGAPCNQHAHSCNRLPSSVRTSAAWPPVKVSEDG